MSEWEAILFVAFESNVSGRENVGGYPFRVMMQADSLLEFSFF